MLIPDFKKRKSMSEENQLILLAHTRDAGFVSACLASALLNKSLSCAYKLLNRLETKGLLRKHHLSDLRLTVWGATETGILLSWQEEEQICIRRAFQPSKLSPISVMHELDLQLAKIKAERAGWRDWRFGHLLKGQLSKRPDAIVVCPRGYRHFLELERHSKSVKRLQQIMSIYLQKVKAGECDVISYVAPNKDLAKRLERLFRSINSVPVNGQQVKLTEQHHARFRFHSLEEWPADRFSSAGGLDAAKNNPV